MMRHILKVLPLIFFAILLSGCSFVFADPDALIAPPASDVHEFKERQLIISLLSDGEQMTTPKDMQDPSPVVNLDVDGDGSKEKIIFWKMSNGFQVGYTVLKEKNSGNWGIMDQKKISGRDIVCFNVIDMDKDGRPEIFFGVESGGYNTLYIFKLHEDIYQKIDQMNYSLLCFSQLPAREAPSIICALSNTSGDVSSTDLNMYEWENQGFSRTFHKTYDGFCQEMNYGAIDLSTPGLILAMTSDSSSVNVMLLALKQKGFKEVLHREVIYVNAMAERKGSIIQDINNDGVLDILSVRPPADASKREPREFLQIWRTWNGHDELVPIYAVIDNKSDGYTFTVPTEWLPHLSYHYVSEKGISQLRFYDDSAGSIEEPAFTLMTSELRNKSDLERFKNQYVILGTSQTQQRIYVVKANKKSINQHPVQVKEIAENFKIEGGQ